MKSGWVYLLCGPQNRVKIGCTTDLGQRMAAHALASGGLFFPVHAIETNDIIRLERELHSVFYRSRIVGEWFRIVDDELDALINALGKSFIFSEEENYNGDFGELNWQPSKDNPIVCRIICELMDEEKAGKRGTNAESHYRIQPSLHLIRRLLGDMARPLSI